MSGNYPDDFRYCDFEEYWGEDDQEEDESPEDYAERLRDEHEGPETYWPLLETGALPKEDS